MNINCEKKEEFFCEEFVRQKIDQNNAFVWFVNFICIKMYNRFIMDAQNVCHFERFIFFHRIIGVIWLLYNSSLNCPE